MEAGYLLIKKFGYLKTPTFSWIEMTPEGGSFSNSGNQRSLKACLEHYLYKSNGGDAGRRYSLPAKYVEVTADDTGYEERTLSEHTTVGALLRKGGK